MGFCVDMFLIFNIFSVSLGSMPESVPLALNKARAERPGRSFRRQTVPAVDVDEAVGVFVGVDVVGTVW